MKQRPLLPLLAAALAALLLAGCRTSHRAERMETHTRRDSVIIRDSVLLRDSTALRSAELERELTLIRDSVVLTLDTTGRLVSREHFRTTERSRTAERSRSLVSRRESDQASHRAAEITRTGATVQTQERETLRTALPATIPWGVALFLLLPGAYILYKVWKRWK